MRKEAKKEEIEWSCETGMHASGVYQSEKERERKEERERKNKERERERKRERGKRRERERKKERKKERKRKRERVYNNIKKLLYLLCFHLILFSTSDDNFIRFEILKVLEQSSSYYANLGNVDEIFRRFYAVMLCNDPIARSITLRYRNICQKKEPI